MPQRYISPEDKDSTYESDDENNKDTYTFRESKGEGSYCIVRLFSSSTNKSRVILSPQNKEIDAEEVFHKYWFYRTIYPREKTRLFKIKQNTCQLIVPEMTIDEKNFSLMDKESYRLVVPEIFGTLYSELSIRNSNNFIQIYLSAVKALKYAHSRGLIIIDLKEDNIVYNEKSKESFLLDGGFSRKKGELLPSLFFSKDMSTKYNLIEKFKYFPPECWFRQEIPPSPASPSMDVYILGVMMSILQTKNKLSNTEITQLMNACTNQVIEQRPSLDELEVTLTNLLEKTDSFYDEFRSIKDIEEATRHKDHLLAKYPTEREDILSNYQQRKAIIRNAEKIIKYTVLSLLDLPIDAKTKNKMMLLINDKKVQQACEELGLQESDDINSARNLVEEKIDQFQKNKIQEINSAQFFSPSKEIKTSSSLKKKIGCSLC
ncbi:protein kinase domain-containing protein [Legionella fairfieldensis]|uniref:protein kinase domain-containing protein n=1 Tax=Legionella fairfieldensis TaxID=45064 RepID=UPI00048C9E07|nr:protein kinase family protein [Legionella fairfieldensis]